MDDSFTFVCDLSDVSDGSMKTFTVHGKRIAIAHIDDEAFAVSDTCTHEGCSLGTEGVLDGTTILCGCHGAQFDATNGQVLAPPAPSPVQSYEVRLSDGKVYIRL